MLEIQIFMFVNDKAIRGQCYIRTERRYVALPIAVFCTSQLFFFIQEDICLTDMGAAFYRGI